MKRLAYFCAALVIILLLFNTLLPPHSHGGPARIAKLRVEMSSIIVASERFKTEYGAYPTGDSAVILRVLEGQNSNGTVFLSYAHRSGHSRDEFVDPWGTPYEISVSTTNGVIVKSAGKNKRFGDTDDWLATTKAGSIQATATTKQNE